MDAIQDQGDVRMGNNASEAEARGATAVDLILSALLPLIGLVIGVFALAKGERQRGMIMIGVAIAFTCFFALFRRH
jgi:hypothetical protein